MKKYLVFCLLAVTTFGAFAQTTFQASIQPLVGSAGVSILVKSSSTRVGKVSGVTLTLAIPVSVGARPPITIDNSPNVFITYPTAYSAVDQTVGGVNHYIYNLIGTGDVVSAGATVTFTANTDVPLVSVRFGGDPSISSLIKVVNLPDGGIDPNPNSFLGLSLDGADVVNEAAMFYAIPSISTASNDGNGYGGTSFAQTVGSVPLPVKFLGFNVTKKDRDAILTWQIENETALTDRYEIMRSVNGVDFKKVYTVAAKNNGNTSNSYDYTEYNLPALRSGGGVIYYRIKQFDKDGNFILTPIKNVRLDGKGFSVGVYPNPIKDYANLSFDLLKDEKVTLTINDASGKQIQNISMQLFKGLNTKKINLSSLAAGSYMLKINTGEEITTVPLVKAN